MVMNDKIAGVWEGMVYAIWSAKQVLGINKE
jgi:hypothetical protein